LRTSTPHPMKRYCYAVTLCADHSSLTLHNRRCVGARPHSYASLIGPLASGCPIATIATIIFLVNHKIMVDLCTPPLQTCIFSSSMRIHFIKAFISCQNVRNTVTKRVKLARRSKSLKTFEPHLPTKHSQPCSLKNTGGLVHGTCHVFGLR